MTVIDLATKSPVTEAPRPDIDPHPLSPYVAWAGNRNKDPILTALKTLLPEKGDVLELATGAGLHINYFAPHFPGLQFQPSDYDADVFESIKAKRDAAGNGNVLDPIRIDLTDPRTYPEAGKRYDAIFVINIFQVAPVAINDGIAHLGQKLLKDDRLIAIYGPFKRDGGYTTESNAAFDKEILAANVPEWGLKDIRDLEAAAAPHGIKLREIRELPANNFILLFKKA